MLLRTGRRGPDRQEPLLPFTRMFIIALLMAGFAVAFSGLAKHTDGGASRPQSSSVTCGEATGVACPTKRPL